MEETAYLVYQVDNTHPMWPLMVCTTEALAKKVVEGFVGLAKKDRVQCTFDYHEVSFFEDKGQS